MRCLFLLLLAFSFQKKLFGQSYTKISINLERMKSSESIESINKFLNLNDSDYSLKRNLKKQATSKDSFSCKDYSLEFKGVPVEYSNIRVQFKNGKQHRIDGTIYNDINISTYPDISVKQGFSIALNLINANLYAWESNNKYKEPKGELIILPLETENHLKYVLTYKFEIFALDPLYRSIVYIDAQNGRLIHENSLIHGNNGIGDTRYSERKTFSTTIHNNAYILYDKTRNFSTVNANRTTDITNSTHFVDNDNFWLESEYNNTMKDNAALDAHWGTKQAYDYFYDTFKDENGEGRKGYDNNNSPIVNHVHYGLNFKNAVWMGDGNIGYGDASLLHNSGFEPFTSLDIVGHEYGHGVSNSLINGDRFESNKESGAIAESLSDIWGACIEYYTDPIKYQNERWLHGSDVINGTFEHVRSIRKPKGNCSQDNYFPEIETCDIGIRQPDTYGGEFWTDTINCIPSHENDKCGIHKNSGVMNYWFYLLCEGGIGTNDNNDNYSVNGIGMNKAQKLIYKSVQKFEPNVSFNEARAHTIETAIEEYGSCSQEVISTTNAWFAVGVGNKYTYELTTKSISDQTLWSGAIIEDDYIIVDKKTQAHPGSNTSFIATQSILIKPYTHFTKGSKMVAYIDPTICAEYSITNHYPTSSRSNYQLPTINTIDGLNQIIEETNILITPNPATSYITIETEYNDKFNVLVYNQVGQLLFVKNNISEKITIDISSYTSGLLYVKINGNTYNFTKKIVKQ